MVSRGFDLMARLKLDAGDFQSGLRNAGGGLQDFSGKLKSIRGPLLAITGALTGAGVLSVKAAIDFETAFAGVRKTVDATEEQFSELSAGIRQMAKELPAGTTEISAVAEAAGQLGIQTDAILSFTKTMVDLGVTTNLTATDAATALARLANITQLPQDQFDRLGSTIVDLGNNLATTEAEIVEMGLRLAAAGKQIGLTEAQTLGFAAALSSVGVEAQAGGTAFSRVMVDIQNAALSGGAELEQFAAVAGMSAQQFSDTFRQDAAGALIAFTQGLGHMSEAGINVFPVLEELGLGEVRVRDALLRAAGAGDLFAESLRIGSDAWEENTALTNEAEQRYGTMASRIAIAKNTLDDLRIEIGIQLLPVVEKLVDFGTKLLNWFQDLPGPVKEFTVILGGVVAGMAALGLILPPVIGLVAAFGVTSNIALAGIPLAIAGIVAGVTFMILKWEEVVAFMKGAGGWILAAFGPIGITAKLVIDNWEAIVGAIRTTVNFLLSALEVVVNAINSTIRAMNKVAGIFGKEIPEIRLELGRWEDATDDVARATKDFIDDLDDAGDAAQSAMPKIDSLATSYDRQRVSTEQATEALERHGNRILSLSDAEAEALGLLTTKKLVFNNLIREAEAEAAKERLDELGLLTAAENAFTGTIVAGATIRAAAQSIQAGAQRANLPGTFGPGIASGSLLEPFSDFMAKDREDRRKAAEQADDLEKQLQAGAFKDSGFFFQDNEGNTISQEQMVMEEIARLRKIAGGALSGGGLQTVADIFKDVPLPLLPGMGGAAGALSVAAPNITVNVYGDVHEDNVSRVAAAVNEAVRRGMIEFDE